MNTIEKILDSIENGDDGNFVIEEKDRISAIKVLLILVEMYQEKGNEDYLHGITDTLNLLLSNKEYEQWRDTWEDY
jgi:hypothetical protein